MAMLMDLFHWFSQHPLAAATMVYAAGVTGTMLYAYFEPRNQS